MAPPTAERSYAESTPSIDEGFPSKPSLVAGIGLILVGTTAMICNTVGFVKPVSLTFLCQGYVCGILYLISGILGVVAPKRNSKGAMIGFLVMCILSAVFTPLFITISAAGLAIDNSSDSETDSKTSGVVINALLVLCSIAGFALSLMGSVLGCITICCSAAPSSREAPKTVIVVEASNQDPPPDYMQLQPRTQPFLQPPPEYTNAHSGTYYNDGVEPTRTSDVYDYIDPLHQDPVNSKRDTTHESYIDVIG